METTHLNIKLLFQATRNVTPVTASQTSIAEPESLDLSPNSKRRKGFRLRNLQQDLLVELLRKRIL